MTPSWTAIQLTVSNREILVVPWMSKHAKFQWKVWNTNVCLCFLRETEVENLNVRNWHLKSKIILTCWIVCLKKLHSHFVSYLRLYSSEEDHIHNGAAYAILSIPCLLMPWRLKQPGHQQTRFLPNKPEYSVSSIRRVAIWYLIFSFRWDRRHSLSLVCLSAMCKKLELVSLGKLAYGCFNSLGPGRCELVIFNLISRLDILSISSEIDLGRIPQDHRIISQHYFGQWLGDVRQQAVHFPNVDPYLNHRMASSGRKVSLSPNVVQLCKIDTPWETRWHMVLPIIIWEAD